MDAGNELIHSTFCLFIFQTSHAEVAHAVAVELIACGASYVHDNHGNILCMELLASRRTRVFHCSSCCR